MNTPQDRSRRTAAFFAATLMTTLIVGSQLGVAQHYTADADAQLAKRQTAPVAEAKASDAARRNAG